MPTSDSPNYDPYALPPEAIAEPPQSLWQALRKIGPGIILAGSIVGSGELILTTSLGAQYGYVFLWLILFSCVIKVFVQIELGRYAISSGKPTLGALDALPGPRWRAHWLVWWWFFMLLCTVSQLGGMTGGVGQALNLAFPEVSQYVAGAIESSAPSVAAKVTAQPEYPWTLLVCLTAILLLWSGGYRRVEFLTTLLVASVTLVTVACVVALYWTDYAIRWDKALEGLKFLIPAAGLADAFGAFGITGVGASELYSYPYFCLEKGYARFTGRADQTADWERRAKGWIRVMVLDAWVSMIVFTIATVAFYFMGAAVLHEQGLNPRGSAMIKTLSQMYIGPFGHWTQIVFLIGAGAVLFKTLYVSSAAHSRTMTDFLGLAGFTRVPDAATRGRYIRRFCVFFPILALLLYVIVGEPRTMVLFGGVAQALTLPVIAGATVYLRYRDLDRRLAPGWLSDSLLWLAFVLLTAVAVYMAWDKLMGLITLYSASGSS